MKASVEIVFECFAMKSSVQMFFEFFSMNSAVEFFFKYFLFKIIEDKKIYPPTDLGDFSFFALSLIEYKRQITCYVEGWGVGG
jgi:hypothetical protein